MIEAFGIRPDHYEDGQAVRGTNKIKRDGCIDVRPQTLRFLMGQVGKRVQRQTK